MHSIRRIFPAAVMFASLVVSHVALAQGPMRFVPVSPCRIVDTRWPKGMFGGPSIQGRTSRIFPVPQQTSCNIPSTAAAYSLNVTLVPPPGNPVGFLSIWPTGQSQPTVSTVNSWDGRYKANAAIVPAGTGGAVSVYVSDTADVVLDINGYFAPVSASTMAFYPLKPCRVSDTRWQNADLGGPSLHASQARRLPILESACGIPSTATAYSFNFTAIPQGGPVWVFSAWPDGQSQPNTSTLNAPTGTVVANAAIVPAGPGGAIDVWASNNSDLAIDVDGYFAPAGPGGLSLYGLPPCRVLDTRYVGSGLPFTGTLNPPINVVASGCGASSLAQAFVFNATIVPAAGPVWLLTLWPDGEAMPGVSTLNAYDASVTSNMAIVPTNNGSIDAYAAGLTHLILDISSYFASPGLLSIATSSLPAGALNTSYGTTLTATGGVAPYTWSVTEGSLPPGLSLNSGSGVVSGMPTATGSYSFTVQVADSDVPQAEASAQFGITISQYLPLSITTTSLPGGTAGTAYTATMTAAGGNAPYTWSIASGTLPAGLALNSSTGVISGTPTTAGTSHFTVQVADSESPPAIAEAQLSITINPQGGNPGALQGNYAFFLNGSNFESGAWTLAGSFLADGAGNITSGAVDANFVGGQPFNTAISGTYFIAANGLNTLTIQGQSWGPVTFAFVLDSSGNGRIIEYDDATGQGSRGSGMLRKQDPTAFTLAKVSGGYVFGMTGVDSSEARMVDVGAFTLASGNISNGACDINDGGSYSTCTFAGSLSAINAQTGRGVSTVQGSNGTTHQAVYVVSAGEFVMQQIDSVPDTQTPLLVGSVRQQSGPFSNASLNGNTVSYMQAIHAGDGADQSVAAIFNFDGNGNFNIVAMDEDRAGTITQDPPSPDTYSVQSNGAVDFGTSDPAGFLFSQNAGFFVGRGGSSIFGFLEPQSGGPFSNASIAGTYAAGSLAPLDYANASNDVDVASANGLGSFTIAGDSSRSQGIDQWVGTIVNYSIAANGRGTGEAQGDKAPAVVYVISPTKFVVLLPSTDAEVLVFKH